MCTFIPFNYCLAFSLYRAYCINNSLQFLARKRPPKMRLTISTTSAVMMKCLLQAQENQPPPPFPAPLTNV